MLPDPEGSDTCLTGSGLGEGTGQPVINSALLPVQKQQLVEPFSKEGQEWLIFHHPDCNVFFF